MPKAPKGHAGKTPVQKSVNRGGKTHQQTFWVDPTKGQPGQKGNSPAHDAIRGLSKQKGNSPAHEAIRGLAQKVHQDQGAHAAEQLRQAHAASESAARASIRARGSGGGPNTSSQHAEARDAHTRAADLHRAAGNTAQQYHHEHQASLHGQEVRDHERRQKYDDAQTKAASEQHHEGKYSWSDKFGDTHHREIVKQGENKYIVRGQTDRKHGGYLATYTRDYHTSAAAMASIHEEHGYSDKPTPMRKH